MDTIQQCNGGLPERIWIIVLVTHCKWLNVITNIKYKFISRFILLIFITVFTRVTSITSFAENSLLILLGS